MLFNLAFKELKHSWRQLLVVALILFVGYLGPLISSSLRTSTSVFLRGKAREMLSADVALVSQRAFKNEEIKIAQDTVRPLRYSREVEMKTMAARTVQVPGAPPPVLITVHGVDSEFPIYSRFRIKTSDVGEGQFTETSFLEKSPIVWVYRDVLVQLGLKIGEQIRIGKTDFTIAGEVVDGPGALRAGFAIAPNVYIAYKYVADTGLTEFGSQVFHRLFFQLPETTRTEVASESLKAALPDPDIFLRTPDDSIQGIERFLKFFSQYLGIVTLMVFALSWTSAFYIIEIYLLDRLRPSAVLMTVGGSRALAGLTQILQIFLVSLFSLACAALVLQAGLFVFSDMITSQLPAGYELRQHASDLFRLVVVAFATAIAFNIPFLAKLTQLKPNILLAEASMAAEMGQETWLSRALSYAPLIVLFWAFSVWIMDSVANGSKLLGGLLIAVFVGWGISRLLFISLFRMLRNRQGILRLAATNLSRGRFGTELCFLALTLVALVLNLVPHLLQSVVTELKPQEVRDRPSLFLFNIPEGSVTDLEAAIKKEGAELRYLTPLILARFEKVNGEAPKEESLTRFPVRVSYRPGPIESETVIEGPAFDGPYDSTKAEHPAISVEERFAERNELKLGDILEFDVQGVAVTGQITNFRRVRWTDFHPNYFIIFQPGVLEDAPKTYISNVNNVSSQRKAEVQNSLIRTFPDMSVVDVGDSISRILEIVDSMLMPIQAIAAVAILMSLLVLLAVVSHNLRLRQNELEVLKVLGANGLYLRRLIVSEYFAIASLSSLAGAGFAIAISLFIAVQLLQISGRVSYMGLFASLIFVIGAAVLIAWFAVWRRLKYSKFLLKS